MLAWTVAVQRTSAQRQVQTPQNTYDVVIISGSASGVAAAIGAARLGASVVLVEPTPVLGGMLANGIGNVDAYSVQALSGVYAEFVDRVKTYYQPIMGADPVFKEHLQRTVPAALRPPGTPDPKRYENTEGVMDPDQGGRWEAHVADQIFKQMVAEHSNIKVFYKRHATGVIKERDRIVGVVTCGATAPDAYALCDPGTEQVFYGRTVVDATPEGDIAAWAGVEYRVGREARSPLEPHAGFIYYYSGSGEILPGSTGQQDAAVVSYGLRITVQNYDAKELPRHILATPPPGYSKADYEYSQYSRFTGREFNPHGKAEVNMDPFGNELPEANWSWPDASSKERQRQYQMFKNRALGFLYYLQHERKLPLGLPEDDYVDNGGVPYLIYVREARRIVGEYTLNESDIVPFLTGRSRIQPIKEDSIAVAHDPLDSKQTHAKRDLSVLDRGEGHIYLNFVEAYQVPYRAILPKQIDGLLVPTAVSATHVAYSSVRLDPGWVVMGQAAGVAAAIAAKDHVIARAVDIRKVQRELLKQKSELMFYWDLPLDHPAFAAVQWLSVNNMVEGYPDRLFRPDQNLTRAEMAALVVNGLKLWPSISNMHFSDVPPEGEAFREIETLYDNHALEALGFKPIWPTRGTDDKPTNPGGYQQGYGFYEYFPSKAVTWGELLAVIRAADQRKELPAGESAQVSPAEDAVTWAKNLMSRSMFGSAYGQGQIRADQPVTRGQASALMSAILDR
jgi:hypothetical protein